MPDAPSRDALEAFLHHEARLLDEARWKEWDGLFTPEGTYWIPATPGQPDPLNHVSIMYEDRLLRAVRIRRFAHPAAYSLQPMPRTVHLVSNVMLDSYDAETGGCIVTSRFIVLQYRRDQQDTYGGAYTHSLVRDGDTFRIHQKKADLVNAGAALENIQIYL